MVSRPIKKSAFPVMFVAVTYTTITLIIAAPSPLVSFVCCVFFVNVVKTLSLAAAAQLQTAEAMHLCSASNSL